jgi:aspartyl-tRNA(Asn)/glutamyl-tRNA(Gln) amidotransferase subunit A
MVWTKDAAALADEVRAGRVKASDALEESLGAIEASALNAVSYLDAEDARARAKEIDEAVARGEDPGLFAGVPMLMKDVHDVAGMPTTHGSIVYRGNIAKHDCTQVARLRAAGAVIVGKSTMSEFGLVAYTATKLYGVTRNPWNLERTPGGSSGGSSAAVAGGLVPIASGGDGGGSIRIPAAYTGLVGMKGTYGRIPRGPAARNGPLTQHGGPLARSVRDVARWYDVTSGYDARDPFSLPRIDGWERDLGKRETKGLRAVVTPDLGVAVLEPEVRRVVEEAAEEFVRTAGLRRVAAELHVPENATRWATAGAPSLFDDLRGHWPDCADDLTYEIKQAMLFMENYRVWHAASVDRFRVAINEAMADLFDEADLVLCATNPFEAYRAEGPMPAMVGEDRVGRNNNGALTIPGNVSGYPAISVPAGLTSSGMPVGLQIYARRHDDALLLDLAAQWEQARPWPLVAPGAPV